MVFIYSEGNRDKCHNVMSLRLLLGLALCRWITALTTVPCPLVPAALFSPAQGLEPRSRSAAVCAPESPRCPLPARGVLHIARLLGLSIPGTETGSLLWQRGTSWSQRDLC